MLHLVFADFGDPAAGDPDARAPCTLADKCRAAGMNEPQQRCGPAPFDTATPSVVVGYVRVYQKHRGLREKRPRCLRGRTLGREEPVDASVVAALKT